MSTSLSVFRLLSLALAFGMVSVPIVAAENEKKDVAAGGNVSLDDPAFNQYVNLSLLGKAWGSLDAGLLTDVALQLAEGERVLQRTHRAISAEAVFDLAVKTAAENRDAKALDRLAGIFERGKNSTALEKVSTARKLAGNSRKADPAMQVSALETRPEQLSVYQDAINGVRAAGLIGDQSYFTGLEEGLQEKTGVLSTLTESQREHLKRLMGQTREAMPKNADSPPIADTLSKLKAVSRQHHHHHTGYGGGGGYGGYGYGGGYGGGGYHLDYHPGQLVPHRGHLDYVPGHYDVHRNSGWYP